MKGTLLPADPFHSNLAGFKQAGAIQWPRPFSEQQDPQTRPNFRFSFTRIEKLNLLDKNKSKRQKNVKQVDGQMRKKKGGAGDELNNSFPEHWVSESWSFTWFQPAQWLSEYIYVQSPSVPERTFFCFGHVQDLSALSFSHRHYKKHLQISNFTILRPVD